MEEHEQEAAQTEADRRQLDEVFCNRYNRIRALAAQVRWNGSNPTLNPTALAHEAYLRLLKHPPDVAAKSYDEVINLLANAMRQILADAARRKKSQKRTAVPLPDRHELPVEEALTISLAIDQLSASEPRKMQIARCLCVLGMTREETARALGLSLRTLDREWQSAKSILSESVQPKSK